MLRKNKVTNSGPVMDSNNHKLITDDLMKAEHINNFFINITENLTTQLYPIDKSTCSTFVTRITPTKDCKDINWELLMRNIQKASNPKKAMGPDLVSPRDLFFVSSELVTYSVLPLYKNSLTSASFPDNWKLSCVTPVFNKDKPCDTNNYRPISLLSIRGKILKAVVCNSLKKIIYSPTTY